MSKPIDLTVILGPASLGLTYRMAGGAVLYVDMPRLSSAEAMSKDDLERTARRQAARLFQTAAEDLA